MSKVHVPTVGDVCQWLQSIAPLSLAEDWDNVGLLIGRRTDPAIRVATCLTLSGDVVESVIAADVQMVVSHHPLPFRPMRKITGDETASSLVLHLARAGVAVYSAHTAFDSAANGINARWAKRLQLQNVAPLSPSKVDLSVGGGRFGDLADAVTASQLSQRCGGKRTRLSGDPNANVRRVAIGCGSGGSFLAAAIDHRCDALVTGEATYHTCLEARAAGINIVMTGHFASERFAMVELAEELSLAIEGCEAFAADESDVVW